MLVFQSISDVGNMWLIGRTSSHEAVLSCLAGFCVETTSARYLGLVIEVAVNVKMAISWRIRALIRNHFSSESIGWVELYSYWELRTNYLLGPTSNFSSLRTRKIVVQGLPVEYSLVRVLLYVGFCEFVSRIINPSTIGLGFVYDTNLGVLLL